MPLNRLGNPTILLKSKAIPRIRLIDGAILLLIKIKGLWNLNNQVDEEGSEESASSSKVKINGPNYSDWEDKETQPG